MDSAERTAILSRRARILEDVAADLRGNVDSVVAAATYARRGELEVVCEEIGAPFTIQLWDPDRAVEVLPMHRHGPWAGTTRWVVAVDDLPEVDGA